MRIVVRDLSITILLPYFLKAQISYSPPRNVTYSSMWFEKYKGDKRRTDQSLYNCIPSVS